MLLEGEAPPFVGVFGIDEVGDDLVVHFDNDARADGDDVLGPPSVVRDELLADFVETVEAAGALGIGAGVFDLSLVAAGESRAKTGREYTCRCCRCGSTGPRP